ncbi:MAG TPA: Holliday junction branch migration protein RuvA, partial [Rhodobiaceae bacterium]|nr:Holliday junction branch migration protein RuvA [Rhodobiaceae bacterium]
MKDKAPEGASLATILDAPVDGVAAPASPAPMRDAVSA